MGPVLQASSPRPPPLALPSSFPKTPEVAQLLWYLWKCGDRVSDPWSLNRLVATPGLWPRSHALERPTGGHASQAQPLVPQEGWQWAVAVSRADIGFLFSGTAGWLGGPLQAVNTGSSRVCAACPPPGNLQEGWPARSPPQETWTCSVASWGSRQRCWLGTVTCEATGATGFTYRLSHSTHKNKERLEHLFSFFSYLGKMHMT